MTVHDKDVSYIRTDDDLPPVAIIDRSPITIRHKILFAAIAVIGAIAWGATELPMIIVMIALLSQWARSDERDARQPVRVWPSEEWV